MSYIYKLTDTRNGKIYIGKHEGNSPYYFTGGIIPNRIIKKHGKAVFKKEIIIKGDFTSEALNKLESFYIKDFDSKNRSIGYNLTDGGEGTPGFKVKDSTKKKMSLLHSGKGNPMYGFSKEKHFYYNKKRSLETRNKISNSLKGKMVGDKNHHYGKKFSKEHRYKLSVSHKGYKHTEEQKQKISNSLKGRISPMKGRKSPFAKKVCQYSIEGTFLKEYRSIMEAEEKLKISHISEACRGKQKTAGGYVWKYKVED